MQVVPPVSLPPASGRVRFRSPWQQALPSAAVAMFAAALVSACGGSSDDGAAMAAQGQQIFRFDTFGDEAQWTDKLRMHEVIASAVDPTTALVGRTEGRLRGTAARLWSKASRTAAST